MAAIPGLIMGVIVMITVKEPQRKGKMVKEEDRVIYLQLLCLSEPVQEHLGSGWQHGVRLVDQKLKRIQTAHSCCTVSYWCSLASSSMGIPHVAPSIYRWRDVN